MNVPLVGGRIEETVAEQVRSLLAAETAFTAEWLRDADRLSSSAAVGGWVGGEPSAGRDGSMPTVDPLADRRYVITLSCPDTTGIVARISTFLADAGGWIVEAGYHSDPDTNWFFTRQVVRADSLPFDADELRERFAAVAAELGAEASWTVTDTGRAQAGGAAGQQGAALPARPARPGVGRRAAGAAGRGDRQPRRARRHRAGARRAVPPRAVPGARARAARARRSPSCARWSSSTTRTRWCWPGSCRSCRPSCAAAGPAGR